MGEHEQPVAATEPVHADVELPEGSATPDTQQPQNADELVNAEEAAVNKAGDEGRRWYNHGQRYVTLDEFRDTPMGRDLLNEPEDAEEQLVSRFNSFPTEEHHRAAGGHWDLQEMVNTEKPWGLLTGWEKLTTVVIGFVKFCAIWGVLYMFIIALGIMGEAFKILGGRSSGRAFRESELLSNPVAGLAIGILATVLMQSSSTTTSIVISMTAADLVTIKNAAYLIMGANIGTSVTNTIVSIAHLNSAAEYRRAFTGAVFHDMFNWLTVGLFLPLEASSGFLVELSKAAVDSLGISDDDKQDKVEFIKKITKPAAGRVVDVDSKLIERIARAETNDEVKMLEDETIIKQSRGHVLRDTPLTDNEAGVMLLFASLTMLATCLLLLVKLLQSVLKGRVAVWTRYLLNLEFKHPVLRACGGLDGYILLLFGTGCTILVQSSSVFTSTLTPLVGIGLIHIEKAVALTHGANIGTTVTGVLSALSGSNVEKGLRVALEHVFFNCLGTVIWFMIWPLRPVPLNMAKFMGETAANLRWFPLAYIISCFLVLPMMIIGLSIPGWEVLLAVGAPLLVFVLVMAVFVWLRRNRADLLPRSAGFLRSETAPCGCRYPNFMQLWGGDMDLDQVDMEEMRVRDEERKAREAAVREWSFSPAAWGLAILAFVGAVLCLPTSQWRRVRYHKESRGRDEIGLGLWEVCSPAYTSDMKLINAPTRACDAALLDTCAAELIAACSADTEWATGSSATKSETTAYQRAFDRCSQFGCRALAWQTQCKALAACNGRAHHAARCDSVLKSYEWFHDVNQDKDGRVQLEFAQPTDGVVVADELQTPRDNGFYDEADDDDVSSATFGVQYEVSSVATMPSFGGVAYDQCTGDLHTVAAGAGAAQHLQVALQFSFTSAKTTRTADATLATSLSGVDVDAVDILTHDKSVQNASEYFVGTKRDSAALLVWKRGEAPREYALSAHFNNLRASRGLKAVAVDPTGKKVVTCLASGVLDGVTAVAADPLQYGRLVRCAVFEVKDDMSLNQTDVKVLLLSDAGAAQNDVQIVGASWLKDDKVALAEQVGAGSNATLRIVEADFAKGSSVMATFNESAAVEMLLVDAAARQPHVLATRRLFEAQVVPVPVREIPVVMPSEVPQDRVSGLVVPNSHTFVLVESNANASAAKKVYTVQTPVDVSFDVKVGKCPSTKLGTFKGGDDCHDISTVCPEGGLEKDMEAVAGLAVSGTLFLGIGTVLITLHAQWMQHSLMGKLLYPAAATLLLAWILLLAAWTHMEKLANHNTYGCYFEDEALRGGLVLHRGKLEYLTMQSYSWAFCIYAWGMLTLSLGAVLMRVVSLRINPHHAHDVQEKEEVAEVARSETAENDA